MNEVLRDAYSTKYACSLGGSEGGGEENQPQLSQESNQSDHSYDSLGASLIDFI